MVDLNVLKAEITLFLKHSLDPVLFVAAKIGTLSTMPTLWQQGLISNSKCP